MTGRDIRDRIAASPSLSRFYAIESGDTLLAVAGRAFGLDSGKARLDAARVINDAAYNDRFRGPANKFFPAGQVSFLPRFIEDPLEQAADDGPAPAGHDFAVLWIPDEGGQEPDLEDPEPAPTPEEDEEKAEPKPTPPTPRPGPIIDWEQMHRGISVPANKPLSVFLRPEVIPVIVVPGILGSAVGPISRKDRRKNGPGWPVNNVGKMLRILFRGALGKRRNLVGRKHHVPDYLQVIGRNDPRLEGNETGLLGVAAQKYEPFINRVLDLNQRRRETADNPKAPLRHFYFRTPPYAFGYNWSADLSQSGQELREFVDHLCHFYAIDAGRCERCILVTHSTGGLVARMALQQDPSFAKRVVAVYHCGVPHVGAAEAYFRMKAGFPQESIPAKLVAWATARNGHEATAVLANIPGGLQLLPGADYRTNAGDRGWLELHMPDGEVRKLPQSSPYEEIFLSTNPYWGMVDKHFLNPKGSADPDHEFEHFAKMIQDVVRRGNEKLSGIEYENAFQVVSKGLPTPDRIKMTCSDDPEVVAGFLSTLSAPPALENEGEYRAAGHMDGSGPYDWYFELQPRDGEGDNTVPSTVADGSHTGAPSQTIDVEGVPHADLLISPSSQWAILQSIEAQLDQLIATQDALASDHA